VTYNHGSQEGQERTPIPFRYVGAFLSPAGYEVFVPERRGYGKSDGPTLSEEIGRDTGAKFIARIKPNPTPSSPPLRFLRRFRSRYEAHGNHGLVALRHRHRVCQQQGKDVSRGRRSSGRIAHVEPQPGAAKRRATGPKGKRQPNGWMSAISSGRTARTPGGRAACGTKNIRCRSPRLTARTALAGAEAWGIISARKRCAQGMRIDPVRFDPGIDDRPHIRRMSQHDHVCDLGQPIVRRAPRRAGLEDDFHRPVVACQGLTHTHGGTGGLFALEHLPLLIRHRNMRRGSMSIDADVRHLTPPPVNRSVALRGRPGALILIR